MPKLPLAAVALAAVLYFVGDASMLDAVPQMLWVLPLTLAIIVGALVVSTR